MQTKIVESGWPSDKSLEPPESLGRPCSREKRRLSPKGPVRGDAEKAVAGVRISRSSSSRFRQRKKINTKTTCFQTSVLSFHRFVKKREKKKKRNRLALGTVFFNCTLWIYVFDMKKTFVSCLLLSVFYFISFSLRLYCKCASWEAKALNYSIGFLKCNGQNVAVFQGKGAQV